MSWTEITIEQARAFVATRVDSTLSKMCSIQAEMSEYYEQASKPEQLSGLLINKAKQYNARAFFYDDGTTEMNLVFKVDFEGKLRCLTSAVGKYKDMDVAVKLMLKKLYDVMEEYKTDYVYGLVPTDTKTLGGTWYGKFLIKAVFIANGFKDIKTTEIEEGRRIRLEVWK
jgi:hypothetical protein